jgi:hypothetical protein
MMLIAAGAGQIALALSSLAIPRLLGWRQELAGVRPLTRNLFWTYAGYTFGIHLWFAAVSIFAASELASGTTLATFVTGFIAIYWGARLILQFTYYDRSVSGERLLFRLAEAAYVTLFAALTLIYTAVALHGLRR